MTDPEFQAWLRELVENGNMTRPQMDDLLSQKALFNSRFGEGDDQRRRDFLHRIVGYVADKLIEGRDIHTLLDQAESYFPGRMLYFEPIGFDLY
jgi:hypothetical protein